MFSTGEVVYWLRRHNHVECHLSRLDPEVWVAALVWTLGAALKALSLAASHV